MKRTLPFFLPLFLVLFACNTSEEPKPTTEPQVKSAAVVPPDPLTQKMDELKKASTMGLDQLSNYLPSELAGLKRSNFSMSSNLGYGVAHADYVKNSRNNIRATIYDCAGDAGAELYKTKYADKKGKAVENADGYTKTIDLNGAQAIESADRKINTTTLTVLTANQVLIVLEGKNFSSEELKSAMSSVISSAKH